jgi:hypothetical protein
LAVPTGRLGLLQRGHWPHKNVEKNSGIMKIPRNISLFSNIIALIVTPIVLGAFASIADLYFQ